MWHIDIWQPQTYQVSHLSVWINGDMQGVIACWVRGWPAVHGACFNLKLIHYNEGVVVNDHAMRMILPVSYDLYGSTLWQCWDSEDQLANRDSSQTSVIFCEKFLNVCTTCIMILARTFVLHDMCKPKSKYFTANIRTSMYAITIQL